MSADKPPSPPAAEDVARIERARLLQATRNAAIQAVEQGWRLDQLGDSGGGRLARLRQLIQQRVVWPLLHPLLARQQEQNVAVLRALYTLAEQADHGIANGGHAHQRVDDLLKVLADLHQKNNLLAQQIREQAAQILGLEEADMQTRAILRGEPPPPPADLSAEAD